MKRLLVVLTVVAGLVVTAPSGASEVTSGPVVECSDDVMNPISFGPRRLSNSAGPLGVDDHFLDGINEMEVGSNRFLRKFLVRVEGQNTVTLSVPPRLRGRVGLQFSPAFRGYRKSVTFEPCDDQPRTIWGGNIRVSGRERVFLFVRVAGEKGRHVLDLGRPKPNLEGLAECRSAVTRERAASWPDSSMSVGSLRMKRHPLQIGVRENRHGHFITRVPMQVRGHSEVSIFAPRRLHGSVFLDYGNRPPTSSVTFRPCRNRTATTWNGTIRVKGRVPVKLFVSVPGEVRARVLKLGRPRATPDR